MSAMLPKRYTRADLTAADDDGPSRRLQEALTRAERQRDEALRRVAELEAALQAASDYCARPSGVCFDPALAGVSPGAGEQGKADLGDERWGARPGGGGTA